MQEPTIRKAVMLQLSQLQGNWVRINPWTRFKGPMAGPILPAVPPPPEDWLTVARRTQGRALVRELDEMGLTASMVGEQVSLSPRDRVTEETRAKVVRFRVSLVQYLREQDGK
jgi:hypothetical protein